MVSSADPHSLHRGDTSRSNIFLFIILVVNACSCAAKINPSISLVNPAYLIQYQCHFRSMAKHLYISGCVKPSSSTQPCACSEWVLGSSLANYPWSEIRCRIGSDYLYTNSWLPMHRFFKNNFRVLGRIHFRVLCLRQTSKGKSLPGDYVSFRSTRKITQKLPMLTNKTTCTCGHETRWWLSLWCQPSLGAFVW